MAKISKKELIRLQEKFKTDTAIGEFSGITRQAVQQLRKKYGIEAQTAANQSRNKRIFQLYRQGISVNMIAQTFKLSIPQTYRIIKDTAIKMSEGHRKLGTSSSGPRKVDQ